jgi:NAD/NADP transhydrogenase alpha subunit
MMVWVMPVMSQFGTLATAAATRMPATWLALAVGLLALADELAVALAVGLPLVAG